jgi:AcrR family transcriptional regulator
MPRPPDPDLPGRILAATDALWRESGDDGVTIRGVAARAKTTTPTVYAHFVDRAALMTALRERAWARFLAEMAQSRSIEDGCARYIGFAERQPHDYELLYGRGWRDRAPEDARVVEIGGFEKLLVNAGVDRRRAHGTALAIIMLLHGAAMSRLANPLETPWWTDARRACLSACRTLIRDASV